jgi:HD-GYP domain-containing protein (c-di-GMP phosphodiesterase class II)
MMTEEDFYKEISIESIIPDLFPDVAVYLKTGVKNYMLYKPHGRKLTPDDLERLERRSSFSIYVRTGDMEEVAAYQEQNLPGLLVRKDLKSLAKGKILFQICADFFTEIVESPPKARDVERCRHLVRQIIWFVSHDKESMVALKAIAADNPYLVTHSVQVAALTMLMHTKIFVGVAGVPLEDVGIGAFLLDLGMTLGDTESSAESASHHEYQLMKLHASIGHDFLSRSGGFSNLTLAVVRSHHERFDGKGYPDHMNGSAIPKGVQISAICDSFSSMTTDRGFKKAVTTEQALQTIKGFKGAHDPALFQSFEKIIRDIKY